MKVFLFDVDDTLYDQLQPFETAYRFVFGEAFDLDIHRLYIRSRKHGDDVFEASERGEMSMDDMHVYRISMAFKDFDIDITREDALLFQKKYAQAQGHIYLSDVTKAFLTKLKERGQCLGVITNGPGPHQRGKIKTLGLERWISPEHAYISGELAVMKPDARIFKHAVRDLKAEELDIFFIGDSYENDIVGAKGAGLKTVWMNRRNHRIPEGGVTPDHEVHTEEQLGELLLSLV